MHTERVAIRAITPELVAGSPSVDRNRVARSGNSSECFLGVAKTLILG